MALIFLGHTKCELCGNILQEGEAITGLPAIANTVHHLYLFFDCGFHKSCYENWDQKEEIEKLLNQA